MKRNWTKGIRRVMLLGVFIFSIGLFINQPNKVEAQLFGSDGSKANRILLEIKKLQTRISEQVIPQIKYTNLAIEKIKAEINQVKAEFNRAQSGNKNVNQQIEILSSVIPSMQGSMEQSQVQTILEIRSLGKRLAQQESQNSGNNRVWLQPAELEAIKKEIRASLLGSKEAVARDLERMAQLSQADFQALIKSNEKRIKNHNSRVDKSIAVMTEIAKGGSKTNETLASLAAIVKKQEKLLVKINERLAVF